MFDTRVFLNDSVNKLHRALEQLVFLFQLLTAGVKHWGCGWLFLRWADRRIRNPSSKTCNRFVRIHPRLVNDFESRQRIEVVRSGRTITSCRRTSAAPEC